MDDMRYEQYGAPMGYQPMEKQQGSYVNRQGQVSRYGNMQIGMGNQSRVPNQHQMNMMEQQKQGPGYNANMGDRNEDIMMSNNRMGPSGMVMRSPMDDKGPLLGRQNTANNYPIPASKQAEMQAEQYENEMNNHNRYRFFPNVFSQPASAVGNLFYALPTSFLFPSPNISAEQIKQFSTTLLLYIFYAMPDDKYQVMAACELYSRDFVYHKGKGNWYRKGSSNYASCKCVEVFDLESCTFVHCEEEYKNRDLATMIELQECLKKSV